MNRDEDFSHRSPALAATRRRKCKTRITIDLDDEVLSHFRTLSERSGAGYQTLINIALRDLIKEGADPFAWLLGNLLRSR